MAKQEPESTAAAIDGEDKRSRRPLRMADSRSSADGLRFWRSKKAEPDGSGYSDGGGERSPSIQNGTTSGYRTYKRRWFGLMQLTLMNVMVSWCWLTYAPVTSDAATYYDVDASAINWLSTAFFLAFVAIFPFSLLVFRRGIKSAFMCAAILLLAGNWIRYAGSFKRSGGSYAAAMVGEILIGFSQPFVLAAPVKYSDLWFTDRGRVTATALPSLANAVGAALGQLISPMLCSEASDVSHLVLYVAIISSISCIPSFFVPSKPSTPVGPSSKTPKLPLGQSVRIAVRSPELWLLFAAFSIFVGIFNAISSLLNQMLAPYGFSDSQAGIGGAILVISGIVFSAISSPILDRTKTLLLAMKVYVPVVSLFLLALVWMPETHGVAGPYITLSLIGAASFALVPIAIEFLADLSHPISPEVTSTALWAGGQLFGAIFVILSDTMVAGENATPPKNMKRFLIFQAVLALAATPMILVLGLFGRKNKVVLKRLQYPLPDGNEQSNELASAAVSV